MASASSTVSVLEAPEPLPHAALRGVAGVDRDHVRAGAFDLIFDRRLRAVAHRHERDDRRDADDHAEHGQAGAHLVAAERLEGDAERHDGGHGKFSAEATAAAAIAAAAADPPPPRRPAAAWLSENPGSRRLRGRPCLGCR